MDVRKTITATLSKEDIEDAITKWMEKKGWLVTHIGFDIAVDFGEDKVLEGATCSVKQVDP